MKWIFTFVIVVTFMGLLQSQETNMTNNKFQIKLEVLELAYFFPRIGAGVSATFPNLNVWTAIHYGWDDIGTFYVNNHFKGQYDYFGISAGANKFTSSGSHYFLGALIAYDKTNAPVIENVFYDRTNNSAILFDSATFHRYRLGFFLHNGFELPIGNSFTIEFALGGGVRYINSRNDEVVNPLVLTDVPPIKVRNKTLHRYAGTSWKPSLIGSIKLGIRL